MKVKYIPEDNLNAIKGNLPTVLKKVVFQKKSLEEVFEQENFVRETNVHVEKFSLDMSQPQAYARFTDIENVQRVYNSLQKLTPSQASDERLWAAYTFSEMLDYMQYRWPAKTVHDLNMRYLFGYAGHLSLFRNGISRLWWVGRISYDSRREDPYELTKFLCKKQDFIDVFSSRSFFSNHDICLAILEALYDAEKKGIIMTTDTVREVAKYINLLAGTYLVDVFSKEEIYAKVQRKLGL